MTVTLLDLHCLNALCDDYENLDAITAEVRRAAHGNVSTEEMQECLQRLLKDGLVDAFVFDAQLAKYVAANVFDNGLAEQWFYISERGRAELDGNWVDE